MNSRERTQRGTAATRLRSVLTKRRGREGFRKGRKESLPPRLLGTNLCVLCTAIAEIVRTLR